MSDVIADLHARSRANYPERYAPDGTPLQFIRGRTWEQKLASWHARAAEDSAPVQDEVEAALEELEPAPIAEDPSAVPAAISALEDDDPFGGIPEADDDAPYARARGEA